MNVRFGSSLALQKSSTSTAVFERLAVVRLPRFERQVLNDCFHQKRPFNFLEIKQIEGLQTTDTVEKLCFQYRLKIICDLSVILYSRYEEVVGNA